MHQERGNMGKIAFIYPGQGVQTAGMGADFYRNSAVARDIFERASEAVGFDMKALCFEKNDRLDLTEYTQVAIVTACLAMTKAVVEAGLEPDMTAGLSLGEYAAIVTAGGMDEMDAIRLVRKRGLLMQEAVPAGVGGMCAVIGLEAEKIEKVLSDSEDVSIANYNCPGQIVITGKKESVEAAAERLKETGAVGTVMLNVSGPFHSSFLIPAGNELAKELEHISLRPLRIPYIANVTAQKVEETAGIKGLLTRQVSSPVRWMQSMETMFAEGVEQFVEIGPGKTLAGFMRKIDKKYKVLNISGWEDVAKVKESLQR